MALFLIHPAEHGCYTDVRRWPSEIRIRRCLERIEHAPSAIGLSEADDEVAPGALPDDLAYGRSRLARRAAGQLARDPAAIGTNAFASAEPILALGTP